MKAVSPAMWCNDIWFPAGGTMISSCACYGYSLMYMLCSCVLKWGTTWHLEKKQDFDFETFDGEKEPTFLCCVRSAQKYNVGNCFRKTALCSVIYVCLNIIHSERLQMKKLCISDLRSPQFWSVLRLTITTQIGLGSLRHRAVAHQ